MKENAHQLYIGYGSAKRAYGFPGILCSWKPLSKQYKYIDFGFGRDTHKSMAFLEFCIVRRHVSRSVVAEARHYISSGFVNSILYRSVVRITVTKYGGFPGVLFSLNAMEHHRG